MNEEPDKLKKNISLWHKHCSDAENDMTSWCSRAMASTRRLLKACLCMENKYEQNLAFEFVNQEFHFTPRPKMFLYHRKGYYVSKGKFRLCLISYKSVEGD